MLSFPESYRYTHSAEIRHSFELATFELATFELTTFENMSFELSTFELATFCIDSFGLASFELATFEITSFELASFDDTCCIDAFGTSTIAIDCAFRDLYTRRADVTGFSYCLILRSAW